MYLLCAVAFISSAAFGQSTSESTDSLNIRSLYDEVLLNGEAYENLRTLTKDIGHRLSGSESAGKAMAWGAEVMRLYGADDVRIMPVMVPHWTRGNVANATAHWGNGESKKLHVTALGGSVGTRSNAEIIANVTVVKRLSELKELPAHETEGRIVLFNRPMDPVQINTGSAYGGAYDQRGNGASAAADVGASGALVRSLTHALDTLPHTGAMRYQDDIPKIPAAAISTVDAAWLAKAVQANPELEIRLEMDCEAFEDVEQGNVIGTWYGTELPDEIITLGGHLDSWDIGEGAHDDGAGVVHTLEVLRLLKAIGYEPRRTLRFVLFINEENGNRGGIAYAEKARQEMEETDRVHVAALESDAGGFVPRGFRIDASDDVTALMRSWTDLFDPYNIHQFRRGGAGVDISPLKELNPRPTLVGLSPDGQRYFDFHHSAQDVFENVHKRELELGAATFAAAVLLLDQHLPSPTP
ncbi:MAG TPA: peptidase M28 family protein [Flavobacteriales bacterium]|mgnify:FL=1|nr:peptidase M28 family protein [Flavobacteriales bacterium]